MKFIPDALGRKIGEHSLLASEKAPKMLFVGGVVGMVGSTVLACRATLKLDDVLTTIENNKQVAEEAKEMVDAGRVPDTTYSDKEYRRDLTIISVRGVGSIVKLYAPSVIVGGVSILALTKSHSLLKDRNLALTAAYAAVDTAFSRYRERVIDRYGDDVDRELRFDYEEVDILNEETGEVTKELQVVNAPGSRYARFYDEDSSRNWSENHDVNMMFLRNVQNYMNDHLKAHGHVFLNQVFSELGLSHTTAGAMVGWRWNKDSGDDFIDFGMWNDKQDGTNEFFNGRDGAILLDFNVDGVIYDKIEEGS